jgi:nitrite reductase (NO-forming)
VLGYLAGLVVAARPLVRAGRAKPPASFATWSVLAGFGWLIVSLVGLAGILVLAPSWDGVSARMGFVVVTLTAGFAAQVLLGALSYLVPVVLGGGPAAGRAATAVLDRGGALRVTLANVALVLSLLPVPSLVLVICTMLVLGALASFLPLLFQAVRVSFRVRKEPIAAKKPSDTIRPGRRSGLVATAVAIVLIAVAGGVAADPASLGAAQTQPVADDVTPTGNTTEVAIEAKDMRFTPSNIEVPVGDRLVVEVTNTDDAKVHDLVFESGQTSGRLAPGESATIDLGVIGRDLDGWCSVAGHRQMGMVLTVDATGEAANSGPADDGEDAAAADTDADEHAHHTMNDGPSAAELLDLHAEPGPEFEPYDPTLAPASSETLHKVTFTVSELEREVAVGVTQHLWTFNGTAPGPTLRGHVGDTFEITLINDG